MALDKYGRVEVDMPEKEFDIIYQLRMITVELRGIKESLEYFKDKAQSEKTRLRERGPL